MKLLHIIASLDDGGAEAGLYKLCLSGTPDTSMVVCLTGKAKYSSSLSSHGVRVQHLNMPRGRLTLAGLVKLFTIALQYRPDVVQTWMYHSDLLGGILARVVGCRQVYWNVRHTNLELGSISRSTRLVAGVCARLSRLVPNRIIACAERARDAHIAFGYEASKFVVIPNGYDVSTYLPDFQAGASVRTELAIAPDIPLVGLVGRWNPQKDHTNLLAAFRLVRANSHLLLVGTGCSQDNAQLVQLVAQAGLSDRVHLLGQRNDIPAIMNALDLHVLSSYSEAFPNVVAEAMACGTPCVVTDVGDASHIVGDTGWVVPPRDSTQLAEAISAALGERQNTPRWAERQHNARQRIVANFSLEAMVARYEAVWSGRDFEPRSNG